MTGGVFDNLIEGLRWVCRAKQVLVSHFIKFCEGTIKPSVIIQREWLGSLMMKACMSLLVHGWMCCSEMCALEQRYLCDVTHMCSKHLAPWKWHPMLRWGKRFDSVPIRLSGCAKWTAAKKSTGQKSLFHRNSLTFSSFFHFLVVLIHSGGTCFRPSCVFMYTFALSRILEVISNYLLKDGKLLFRNPLPFVSEV